MNGEYRVKVSVRNNLLLSAIEDAGFSNVAAFCKANHLSLGAVRRLLSFASPPINKEGEFTDVAKQLMEVLGAAPSDLWTDEQLNLVLKRNSSEIAMTRLGVMAMFGQGSLERLAARDPEDVLAEKERVEIIKKSLSQLSPRMAGVLKLRYGIGGLEESTLDQVGDIYEVSRERVRQVEAKAFRYLRRIAKSNKLNEYLDLDEK